MSSEPRTLLRFWLLGIFSVGFGLGRLPIFRWAGEQKPFFAKKKHLHFLDTFFFYFSFFTYFAQIAILKFVGKRARRKLAVVEF